MYKDEIVIAFFQKTKIEFTFAELLEYFAEVKGWKKQTLNTYLRNLVKKGLIIKESKVKTVYRAISEKEYEQIRARNFLEKNYQGNIGKFIAALSGKEMLSEDDKKDLFEYIFKQQFCRYIYVVRR